MTLLTVKELMALLRVKRSTLYALRDQGLPVIRIGRSIRFDQDEVVAWVRSQRLQPGEPMDDDDEPLPARSRHTTSWAQGVEPRLEARHRVRSTGRSGRR